MRYLILWIFITMVLSAFFINTMEEKNNELSASLQNWWVIVKNDLGELGTEINGLGNTLNDFTHNLFQDVQGRINIPFTCFTSPSEINAAVQVANEKQLPEVAPYHFEKTVCVPLSFFIKLPTEQAHDLAEEVKWAIKQEENLTLYTFKKKEKARQKKYKNSIDVEGQIINQFINNILNQNDETSCKDLETYLQECKEKKVVINNDTLKKAQLFMAYQKAFIQLDSQQQQLQKQDEV